MCTYPGLRAQVGWTWPQAGIRIQAQGPGLEALRRNVAGPPTRRVKEIGEIRGIVLGEEDGLEGGKVGEEDPGPGGHQQVLQLDVTVEHGQTVRLLQETKRNILCQVFCW